MGKCIYFNIPKGNHSRFIKKIQTKLAKCKIIILVVGGELTCSCAIGVACKHEHNMKHIFKREIKKDYEKKKPLDTLVILYNLQDNLIMENGIKNKKLSKSMRISFIEGNLCKEHNTKSRSQ